jgi:hypothetical protein
MLRRLFLLAVLAPALTADPRQEIYDLLGAMANALSEGSTSRFLEPFDRTMQGYEDLAADVNARTAQTEVSSSIELVDDTGDAERRTVRVDWLLQIRDKENQASKVRRQKTIQFRFEKQKRKWRIVSLEPHDFFAPPRVVRCEVREYDLVG